jgi:hypothetical protein
MTITTLASKLLNSERAGNGKAKQPPERDYIGKNRIRNRLAKILIGYSRE